MTTTTRGSPPAASGLGRKSGAPAPAHATARSAEIFAEQQQHLFDCVRPLYDDPLAIAAGSGCRVTDYDGREYLDAFAGH